MTDVGSGFRHFDFATTYDGQVSRGSFDYQLPTTTGTTSPRGI